MIRLPVRARSFKIRDDRRNPDGVEPHVLDVIQVTYDALIGTTAMLAVLRVAGWSIPIGNCETVRDKLVTFSTSAMGRRRGTQQTW